MTAWGRVQTWRDWRQGGTGAGARAPQCAGGTDSFRDCAGYSEGGGGRPVASSAHALWSPGVAGGGAGRARAAEACRRGASTAASVDRERPPTRLLRQFQAPDLDGAVI